MKESCQSSRPPRILLAVCGGVAAYKALELARLFVKQGADVQTVLTAGAQQFVTALSFQALTGRAPRGELFDTAHEAAMGHIELARWPDAVVVAPASAHLLAQMAAGLASDLLTTLLLATNRPVWVAPAMNPQMWAHAATQANTTQLTARGINFIAPSTGLMACGDTGEGRLADVNVICSQVMRGLQQSPLVNSFPLSGFKAVVTAGPTREPIDPVRFITNRSSGKQGFAVAEALAASGAQVTVIAGPTALTLSPGIRRLDVESAQQMLDAVLSVADDTDLLVSAAAIADYRMQTIATHKMKKTGDELNLRLIKNPDILTTLRALYPQLFLVGFAAETERLAEHAREKLVRKGLDIIAANLVGDGKAFDKEDNALSVFWSDGEREIAHAPKNIVAQSLIALISERLASRERPGLNSASST